MPKPTKGPRLGGGPAHERLMLANLSAALFSHRSIKTTETKAKRLRPFAERLITFAKRGDIHARRRVQSVIGDKEVVHVLFTEIAPLVQEREGGYTRVTKIGNRKGDNAPMAVIELVLEEVTSKKKSVKKKENPITDDNVDDDFDDEAGVPDAPEEASDEDNTAADDVSEAAAEDSAADSAAEKVAGDDEQPAGDAKDEKSDEDNADKE